MASRPTSLRRNRVLNLARRLVTHPSWGLETIGFWFQRRRESRRPFSLERHAHLFRSELEALALVTGRPLAEIEPIEEESRAARGRLREGATILAADPELLVILGGLVRLLKPAVVIETGVDEGVSTALILEAMEANSAGHLYSVDLPILSADARSHVGSRVPAELRHRWSLTIGPSSETLPSLVESVAPLDVFVHDADHTYASQLTEYRTAWPALREGGVLVSDDVQNPAFLDFAAEASVDPCLVGDPSAGSAVGLLRKGG